MMAIMIVIMIPVCRKEVDKLTVVSDTSVHKLTVMSLCTEVCIETPLHSLYALKSVQ